MDFDDIWDTLMTRKNSSVLQELPELLIIENSFSSKEYYLTHFYLDSYYEYQALDSENCSYHVRILPMQSFDDVKTAYKNFSMLQEHTSDFYLTEIKDMFEIYDRQWVLVIVSELVEGMTLGEISDYMENIELPKEIGVLAYTRLIDIIEKSYEAGVILNVSPETILLVKQDSQDSLIFSTGTSHFNIKLLTSNQISRYSKNKYEGLFTGKRNTLENEIWGSALVLFLFFSHKNLESLFGLKNLKDEEKVTFLTCSDPVVNSFLISSLKSHKTNIIGSPVIKIWKIFIEYTWDQLDDYPMKDITPLLTILKFNTSTALIASVKKILMVTNEHPNEVSKVFMNTDLLIFFFKIVKENIDFYKYPSLINSIFLILKEKSCTPRFISGLMSVGILEFFDEHWLSHAKSDLICKFTLDFMNNNTNTIFQILWDKGFIDNLCKKPVKSQQEIDFLKQTMSFYGGHSISFIEKISEILEINTFHLLQNIYEVPLSFKQDKFPQILSLIKKLTIHHIKSNDEMLPDILKSIVFNLSECFLVPQHIQKQHIEGQCTNRSTKNYLAYIGKNPLILLCNVCKMTYCLMCFNQFHRNHDSQYFIDRVFRCNEKQKIVNPERFDVKVQEYSSKFEMKELHQSGGELGVSFLSIQNLIVDGEPNGYFECYIARATFNENFYFGIWGTGIVYHAESGLIKRNGHTIGTGPRAGSYDTVGCGISKNRVYFTYNGLLVRPVFNCSVYDKPKVYYGYFGGDECLFEVKHQKWMFLGYNKEELRNLPDCNEILKFIFRKLRKIDGKKLSKIEDVKDKFLELIYELKKEEMFKKEIKLLQKE